MATARGKYTLAALRTIGYIGRGMIFRLGFWTSIILPFVYVPLLIMGHPLLVDISNFSLVVTVHIGSIYVGKDHGRS